jgi:8-oxo-dGTP pyrophosphatase MutT (NUDIX family)
MFCGGNSRRVKVSLDASPFNPHPEAPGPAELKIRSEISPVFHPANLFQIAALPIRFEDGKLEVMLVTSRETKRWVIPKGWPMKGKKNWAAAAQEAREEAGVIGKTLKRPVGEFYYFKRRAAHFDLCRVEVYLLGFEKRLEAYREKGQREARWFPLEEAAEVVEEPGLTALLQNLDFNSLQKPTKKKSPKPGGGKKQKKS